MKVYLTNHGENYLVLSREHLTSPEMALKALKMAVAGLEQKISTGGTISLRNVTNLDYMDSGLNSLPICNRCKFSKAQKLHACPFEKEINDDNDTLCNCCECCQTECQDSI